MTVPVYFDPAIIDAGAKPVQRQVNLQHILKSVYCLAN
jgi:hypothetical protein